MIDAYDVATIRALEAEAIAEVGEDTLMQRAASGVAAAVGREAAEARGRTYGTKILILVGPGNNGGDALFAGARLAARGATVRAVRCLGEPHAGGLAALRSAGGRRGPAVRGVRGVGRRPGASLPGHAYGHLRAAQALPPPGAGTRAVRG